MSFGSVSKTTLWPAMEVIRYVEACVSKTFGMRKSQKTTARRERFEENSRRRLYVARKKRVRQHLHGILAGYRYY